MHKVAVLGAVGLVGLIACGPVMADPLSCNDIGGVVESGQICHSHNETPTYTIDITVPADYPDSVALMTYLTQRRDELIDYANKFPLNDRSMPYQLSVTAKEYRSGPPATGTRSVVLQVGEDVGVHPVSSMKAFNYDVGMRVPITFDSYFRPAAIDVIAPAVRQALTPDVEIGSPVGTSDPDDYRNFAITDDAIIFFFDQDQMFGQNEGPLQASVPRAVLAPVLN